MGSKIVRCSLCTQLPESRGFHFGKTGPLCPTGSKPDQTGAAQTGIAQVGGTQTGAEQIGIAQVGDAQVGIAQTGTVLLTGGTAPCQLFLSDT